MLANLFRPFLGGVLGILFQAILWDMLFINMEIDITARVMINTYFPVVDECFKIGWGEKGEL